MSAFERENEILPEFPRTPHLPFQTNAGVGDRVASPKEAAIIFRNPKETFIEEKLDAANSGICLYESHPIIRNRNHILQKGYGRKRTPAKMQFTRIWNWYYENAEKFERLNKAIGFPASVYGEWMYYQATIYYDRLPSFFMAYDIYDSENKRFIATPLARMHLKNAGFNVAPLLQVGVKNYEELTKLLTTSPFSDERREGVYVKVTDGVSVTHRFKMVRPDYKPGVHFGERLNKLGTPKPFEEPPCF